MDNLDKNNSVFFFPQEDLFLKILKLLFTLLGVSCKGLLCNVLYINSYYGMLFPSHRCDKHKYFVKLGILTVQHFQ